MSLYMGILAMTGDHRQDIDFIFNQLGYTASKEPKTVADWPALREAIGSRSKAVCQINGWTVILDPEMALVAKQKNCTTLSKTFDAKVYGMFCEDAGGAYCFAIHEKGELLRAVMTVDGEVIEEEGTPLPEEKGLAAGRINAAVVMATLRNTVCDYGDLEKAGPFKVYPLRPVEFRVASKNKAPASGDDALSAAAAGAPGGSSKMPETVVAATSKSKLNKPTGWVAEPKLRTACWWKPWTWFSR